MVPPFGTYWKDRLIGTGSFGKVYLAVNPHGRQVAFKEINLANRTYYGIKRLTDEADKMHKLDCPFIVKNYGHFVNTDYHLTIVMEYAEYGNLHDHVKRYEHLYNESRILDAFAQLVLGLSYLHERRIVHRGISTTNILVTDDWNMMLSDITLTDVQDSGPVQSYFLAPEIVFGNEKWNYLTDVWALGVAIFYMATTGFPYYGHHLNDLYYAMKDDNREDIGDDFPDVEDLLTCVLEFNPNDRSTCEDLLDDDRLSEYIERVSDRFYATD